VRKVRKVKKVRKVRKVRKEMKVRKVRKVIILSMVRPRPLANSYLGYPNIGFRILSYT